MIACQNCGAECMNGLALCDLCRRAATTCLEFIPVHFRNLSRWRPGSAGSRPVPSSREPKLVSNSTGGDRVARALDEVGNDLTVWARRLEDERRVVLPEGDGEAQQAADVCSLLAEHLTSISTTDWAGDLVADLQRIEGRLANLTAIVVPGWYAGACRQPVGFDDEGAVIRCGTDTHVVPGLTWVTCPMCRATTYARDHLPVILEEAGVWIAPPKRLAEVVVALVDGEHSVDRLHKRIAKWGERDQLETVRRLDDDGDPIGPKRHRLGEVLDILHREGATRLDNLRDRSAS